MTDRQQSGQRPGSSVAHLSPLHWGMILLAAFMFGVAFLFIKTALIDIPPLSVALLRCAIAAPIAWIILNLVGGSMPGFQDSWRLFLTLGILTAALPFAAIAYGQSHIESALAGMLFGSLPVFNVLLVPLIARDEAFQPLRLLGAMIGFVGMLIVMAPKYSGGMDANLLSMLLIVFAAASYATGVAFARRNQSIHPIAMIVGQLIWAVLLLAPLVIYLEMPWQKSPSVLAWTGMFGVGILATAFAPALLFLLIRSIGGTRVALIPLFVPVFATLAGIFILGEQIPGLSIAGLGVILAGAVLIARSRPRDRQAEAGTAAPPP